MNGPILFEDAHLLVVHKPAGLNTHKPDRFAPDGLHEWLTARAPRWRTLSILHRLDRDTSGVLVFGKTTLANQSLTRQFTAHAVAKQYLLLTTVRPRRGKFRAHSPGAETEFEFLQPHGPWFLVAARPVTGKTHQIRRHAAANGFPISGDTEYGGATAPRLMLHAHQLTLAHPASGKIVTFEASVPAAFEEPDALVAAAEYRDLLFGPAAPQDEDDGAPRPTDCFRLSSGAADGFPEAIVDSYAGRLLVQWQRDVEPAARAKLYAKLRTRCAPVALWEQLATKRQRTAPALVWPAGTAATPVRFRVSENGLSFWVGFGAGLGTGIFLDQRENRRRLQRLDLNGKSVLNCFAYTCAFSVAAARAGAAVTSVDVSRNYLAWGRENFQLNGLDLGDKMATKDGAPGGRALPAVGESAAGPHEFIRGDVFDWLGRFARRGRRWAVVILDPPTFSTTRNGRAFQAERDYADLVGRALPLVAAGGTLFCSTNQRTLAAAAFVGLIERAVRPSGRLIRSSEYATLPPDFRVAAGERPHLKTVWVELGS